MCTVGTIYKHFKQAFLNIFCTFEDLYIKHYNESHAIMVIIYELAKLLKCQVKGVSLILFFMVVFGRKSFKFVINAD